MGSQSPVTSVTVYSPTLTVTPSLNKQRIEMQIAGDILLLLLVAVTSVAAVSVCPGEGGRYDNDNNDLSNNDDTDNDVGTVTISVTTTEHTGCVPSSWRMWTHARR